MGHLVCLANDWSVPVSVVALDAFACSVWKCACSGETIEETSLGKRPSVKTDSIGQRCLTLGQSTCPIHVLIHIYSSRCVLFQG